MIRYVAAGLAKLITGANSGLLNGNVRGNLIVSDAACSVVAVTPAGTDIANAPCDFVYLTADANVTFIAADDADAGIVTVALAKGRHGISMRRVTVVSAGTLFACWARKPL